jgi:hypothetical protein
LNNEHTKLEGKGKLIRHIKVSNIDSFPKEEITKMIFEAVAISEANNPDLLDKRDQGKSIIMSISDNKRRPKKDI